MKSLIYYKGHDIYELYDNLKKSNSSECCICLEGEKDKNFDPFYEYENTRYIIKCKCRPNIHKECFYEYVHLRKKCVICNQNIVIQKTKGDKLKENIVYFVLTSTRYLVTFSITFCIFQIIKIFFV
jgi:hypothetical protein